MSVMPPVALDTVSLGYEGRAVVHDVSLVVRAGEVVGLVGPNGAGKTTIVRAIAGAGVVFGGEVRLCGTPVASLSSRERARRVAVLPQSVTADISFGVKEFVEMGRHARIPRFGAPGALDGEVVDEVMRRTDTASLAGSRITSLSGGDLQRLALAQALAQEPSVLLLDEPTSHLDINHRLQILDLVRGLAQDGLAVLGIFHDLDLAARYADRVVVLKEGRIVCDGSPESVITPEMVRDVFAVRAAIRTDAATGAVSVTPLLRDDDVARPRGCRVVVVGGSGHGAWFLRRLVLDGWDVALAAISIGDTDHDVAQVLGVDCVGLPPFGGMDETAEEAVRVMVRSADVVLVSRTSFGRANVGNLRAATQGACPVVLVGTMDRERDFTDGEATRLWEAAEAGGAWIVDDEEAALAAIERVTAS